MDHAVDAGPAVTWSFDVPPIAVGGVTHTQRPPSWRSRLRGPTDAVLKFIGILKAIEWVVDHVEPLFSAATVRLKRTDQSPHPRQA